MSKHREKRKLSLSPELKYPPGHLSIFKPFITTSPTGVLEFESAYFGRMKWLCFLTTVPVPKILGLQIGLRSWFHPKSLPEIGNHT